VSFRDVAGKLASESPDREAPPAPSTSA
jgi:hypothetical protein